MGGLADWQLILQIQIREIERSYPVHEDLLDWGRWGRGLGGTPQISASGIWSMPGEYDPELDPDAIPESPRRPINERRVRELDALIGDLAEFPAVWRKALAVNYIGARCRTGYYVMVPEWQRPNEARMSSETYRLALSGGLRHLTP